MRLMGLLAALLEVLLWKMTDSVGMYDCYDTKCRGEGVKFNNTYIKCDNYHNYCDYTNQGHPICQYSDLYHGNGVSCNITNRGYGGVAQFRCGYDRVTGRAYCKEQPSIVKIVVAVFCTMLCLAILMFISTWYVNSRSVQIAGLRIKSKRAERENINQKERA